jgi:hypothetical protein
MGKQQNGEIDINMVKVKAHEVPQKLQPQVFFGIIFFGNIWASHLGFIYFL